MAEIKNIIFDFGNILIPIEEERTHKALRALGAKDEIAFETELYHKFEVGEISSEEFLRGLQKFFFRKVFINDIKDAWNALLLPFPEDHVRLLKRLKKKYKLFLFSNTNELHINQVKQQMGIFTYKQFTACFEAFYYSQELGMRKPDATGFEHILKTHDLKPEETFFIDDRKENTDAASELGIEVWNLNPETETIYDLDKVLSERHS